LLGCLVWTSGAAAECFRIGDTITCIDRVIGGVNTTDTVTFNIRPSASIANIPSPEQFGFCPLSPPVISVGAGSTVTNDGVLVGFGTCGAGIVTGDGSTVINRGSVDTLNAAAAAIDVLNRSRVVNSGGLRTIGAVSNGVFGGVNVDVALTETSSIQTFGIASSGVFLGDNSSVTNAGLIRTSGVDAHGLDLFDDPRAIVPTTARVSNTGLIEAAGQRAIGVRAASDTLTITNGGQIRATFQNSPLAANFGIGASLSGEAVSLTNTGMIRGAGAGVEIAATQALNFLNSGTITAEAASGRAVNLAGNAVTFLNRGVITGRQAGVRLAALQRLELENLGVIEATGDGDAGPITAFEIITPANAPITLSNTGRISAAGAGTALRLAAGNDTVFNSGELRGGVALGDGDDLLILRQGGSLAGPLDGGGGTDRLLLLDSGVLASTFTAMEDLVVLTEGRWSLAQDATVSNLGAVIQGELALTQGRTLTAPRFVLLPRTMLSGEGVVRGNAEANGILAPGAGTSAGIGTLSIVGNLTQDENALTQIDLGAEGLGDRIAVTGTAQINGALIIATAGGTRFRGGERYDVLTATQGISGAFARITGMSGTFLTSTTVLSPDNRSITIRINRIPYASVAQTPGQTDVARAVDGALSAGRAGLGALFDQLDGLDDAGARSALDQLSPRMPGAVLATLDGGNRVAMSAIPTRTGDENRIRTWGHIGRRQGSPGRAGYAFDMNAVTAGIDASADAATRVGIALSAQDGDIDQSRGTGVAALDQTLVAAYAIHQWRDITVSGGAAWADGQASLRRSTGLPFTAALQGVQTADADTSALGGFVRASRAFSAGPLRVTSRLGVEAWRTTLGGFNETGPLALSLPRQRMNSLRPMIGAEVSGASRLAAPFLSLTGSYELLDNDPALAAFAADPATRFAAPGVPARKTWLTAQAGVRAALGGTATLRLGFEGNLTDASQGHSVFVGVSMAW